MTLDPAAIAELLATTQGQVGLGVVVLLIVAVLVAVLRPKRPSLEELEAEAEPAAIGEPSSGKPAVAKPSATKQEPSALQRFKSGLTRTSDALGLGRLFGGSAVDEALFEALEEALISADVGARTSMALIDALRSAARSEGITEPAELKERLRAQLKERLTAYDPALLPPPPSGPHVILVVGVNGSGKTTTIGKLAARLGREGKKVLLGAGDTFRAGAIEQLRIWSERAESDFVAHQQNSDPAAVLFDALDAAKARKIDVVLCDTAGRLQARKDLMNELGKVTRVLSKSVAEAPHEVLLVLDGTMGQNALSQARVFGEVTGVTGVVLTKLDGTAKGGVVVAVMEELGLPVKFIGIGEGTDDLRPFDPEAFVDALL